MAPLEKLVRVAFVEGAGDEEYDVVNHVAVCNKIKERAERFDGIASQEVELVYEELGRLVIDGRS